jgi:hypothetical protein
MNTRRVATGHELIDVDRYVAATAGHFRKNGNPARKTAVEAQIRHYAENILPGLMIDRRDPIVLRAQGESADQ